MDPAQPATAAPVNAAGLISALGRGMPGDRLVTDPDVLP
jgi:hypothetical protein